MLTAASATLLLLVAGANPYLTEGRRTYEQVRYKEAEEHLRLAVQVPTSTRGERRESFDLLARTLAAQGRFEEAEGAYLELLAQDAHAPEPSDAAPKIRALHRKAKERLFAPDYVRLSRMPAAPGELQVAVLDPWAQVESLLLWRWENESFASFALGFADGLSRGPLPARSFFLEARRADGSLAARLGSPEAPLAAMTELGPSPAVAPGPSPAPPGPQRRTWPRWALMGAAAASAVAGAALSVAAEEDYRSAGAATGAREIRRLDQQYRERAIAGRVLLGAGVVAGAGVAVSFAW